MMDEGREENQGEELYRPETSVTLQTFLHTSGLSEDLLITARVHPVTATVEKQMHGEKRHIFRGPCVQKQPVAVPCSLCSRRANYPSFCSSVEQFMPQPHALNTSPSKAGSEWLSHIFA